MHSAINWFEIPVSDFDRAKKFYSEINDSEMHEQVISDYRMGFFGDQNTAVGGAIVYGEGYIPSAEGSLLYLNGGEDLNNILNRIEPAGGKILLPKTQITPEIGYYAIFLDTEGNKLALHSLK